MTPGCIKDFKDLFKILYKKLSIFFLYYRKKRQSWSNDRDLLKPLMYSGNNSSREGGCLLVESLSTIISIYLSIYLSIYDLFFPEVVVSWLPVVNVQSQAKDRIFNVGFQVWQAFGDWHNNFLTVL